MGCDRTRPSTADALRAKATVKYNGREPTYMVSVGLPVPPGLTAGAGELAEPIGLGLDVNAEGGGSSVILLTGGSVLM